MEIINVEAALRERCPELFESNNVSLPRRKKKKTNPMPKPLKKQKEIKTKGWACVCTGTIWAAFPDRDMAINNSKEKGCGAEKIRECTITLKL